MDMNTNISVDDLLGLPAGERIRLVEVLWDSIAAEPESVPVTPAQKREIEARLEDYRRDPSIAIPWEVARARLRAGR